MGETRIWLISRTASSTSPSATRNSPDSPIAVDDENGLLDFLRDAVGVLHDGKGNWLTDEQALYILETSGVGSLYDMRTGLYSTDGKAISTKAELAG